MDVTVTGKDTRSTNRTVELHGPANEASGLPANFYVAYLTGSCFTNVTVPAVIAT